MSAPSLRSAYKSLVSEVSTAAASVNAASKKRSPIDKYIRHVFGESEEHVEQRIAGNEELARRLRNVDLFLRSKRTHAELIARYNPVFFKTEEERIRMTARRVGLDVPKTSSSSS